MNTPTKSQQPEDYKSQDQTEDISTETNDLEDDGTPVLDEADLEENNLTVDEAEDIEWEDTGTATTAEDEDDEDI